jgi:hypothetical protein
MRPAVRILAALALPAALAARPARANVTGNVEVQTQTTQSSVAPGAGTTQSTLLMESLALHYAGLPFGPDVAIATAGGGFSNVTGWGSGMQLRGRVFSFDGSVGFLPRRAVPLRLYAGGSIEDGATGVLASRGPGPSVLYGGALNLEPSRWLPGLRLDASEGRSSRPGHDAMSDVQRRVVASGFGNVGGQRVNMALRLDDDHRDLAGDQSVRSATLDVSSPRHQTTFLYSETHRSLAVEQTLPPTGLPALPPPSGITSDRLLSGTSDQRWSPALSTQLAGRLSDAGADGASGRVGDARAAVIWVPVRATSQLTLSANGSAGFAQTTTPPRLVNTDAGPQLAPEVDVAGASWGAGTRAALSRPFGPLSAGIAVGASANGFSTTSCRRPGAAPGSGDCGFGSDGVTRQLDATGSLALPPSTRFSGTLEHTVARAVAPIGRGGDRLENHSRATGRLPVGDWSAFTATLAYDDGFRELYDIDSGRAAGVHEQAVTGSLGLSTHLGRVALSTEARHSRGAVVTGSSIFVAGGATQVRSMTSGYATASWSPLRDLALQAQVLGSRADLTRSPGITSAGANAALVWRLGRMNASVQYQGARVQYDGQPPTLQQSIRTLLSRPFELWR